MRAARFWRFSLQQRSGIGIDAGDLFHGRPAVGILLQTVHDDGSGVAEHIKSQFQGRERRRLPDRPLDLRLMAVERMFSRARVIGRDAKGEDVALETLCEIALPFLRGRIFDRARRVVFLVGDDISLIGSSITDAIGNLVRGIDPMRSRTKDGR